MRRDVLKLMLAAGVAMLSATPSQSRQRFAPLAAAIAALEAMTVSPFPFHGDNPETGEPFINVRDGKRIGHKSPRGGVRWEDETYSDRRALFALPPGFDLARPAALVVFFHGNEATLERDVIGRQNVPGQLAQSGLNAVLAAPQFAVDARDSSPGNFWRAEYFASWLAEAGKHLARLHGQGATAADFNRLPIVLVAYSGGYSPAAWCLKQGGATRRIAGVVLLDGLYGDIEKFADWAVARRHRAFLFSAYSKASREWNVELQEMLEARGIDFARRLPEELSAGGIYFAETPEVEDHVEYLSAAWTADPLTWLFKRIPAYRHL
ncbi:MAG: alpha/beta hydrolase [Rhizobiales bacterium]|nr:alpha/beta hydrolase [Hyphomicrobiales bacterium]MBI3673399.1 alpha/beta hydrolase [Hyphomicrobiales bacterium]